MMVSGDFSAGRYFFCSKIGILRVQGTLGSRKNYYLEVPDG